MALKNGKCHRLNDLPAVEYENGTKEWWVDGVCHRLNDLPAFEGANGGKEWWVNGELHRLGCLPAVVCAGRSKESYIYGIQYNRGAVYNYYKTLARFGRCCLEKIRLAKLRKARQINNELLCMPPNYKLNYVGYKGAASRLPSETVSENRSYAFSLKS